ncbi:MAG: glycosyltransferase family 4 protein [Candidatus Magasanikbacteria bacterium]|nr:glycosyltransferase family 4 protein [Candidatus Magasanikbacteria bacterium]
MKRTLIITLEYPPQVGGIATYVKNLGEALVPEQTVILAPFLKGEKHLVTQEAGLKIFRTKQLSRFFWPHWLKLFWQVRKIVKKEKIEVIIVHHILPVGYVAVLINFFRKIPFIIFSHGTDIAAASRRPWKRRMVKIICQRATQIICNSASLARRFSLQFTEFSHKVQVVYPGPEALFFATPNQEKVRALAERLAIAGRPTIISVARMVDGKGFPHLVRVIKKVADRSPSLAWLIIGTGPKLAEILDLVQKNSLQNIVRFMGEVPHHELPDYFHASTVFTLLTHPDNGFEEGLGLVFLEAAAAGLPCVAGKSGGVEEAVLNGQTGYVFDAYQDENAIADTLYDLINNPDLAKKLGQAGKTRVTTEFNFPNQLKKLAPWLD